MTPRARGFSAPLLRLATASYLASCALGTAVATGVLVTGRARWVHHALFVSTATLTGATLAAAGAERRRAGWWLLPVVVPLAVVPYAGTRSRRHVIVAVAAAPCYAAALAADRR